MNELCENVFEVSTLQSSNIVSPKEIIHLVEEDSFQDERGREASTVDIILPS